MGQTHDWEQGIADVMIASQWLVGAPSVMEASRDCRASPSREDGNQ